MVFSSNATLTDKLKYLDRFVYLYILEICVLIFPKYSAQNIEVERDVHRQKKKTTLKV